MEKTQIKQAHGLTHDQIADLRIQQLQDEVETRTANNAGENINDPYFKEQFADHQIPTHEAHLYHVVVEDRAFKANGPTPVKTSEPVVHTFTKEAFAFQKKHNGFHGEGKQIHILHDPTLEGIRKIAEDKDDGENLNKFTVEQLKQKYLAITGEDAPAVIKKAELIKLIEDAQK